MRRGSSIALAVWLAAAHGCTTERAGRGESCTRSTQCEPGLACVEGECSGDIDELGEQGEVPMLMPDAPDAAARDAAVAPPADGAAPEPDAAAVPPDAG